MANVEIDLLRPQEKPPVNLQEAKAARFFNTLSRETIGQILGENPSYRIDVASSALITIVLSFQKNLRDGRIIPKIKPCAYGLMAPIVRDGRIVLAVGGDTLNQDFSALPKRKALKRLDRFLEVAIRTQICVENLNADRLNASRIE